MKRKNLTLVFILLLFIISVVIYKFKLYFSNLFPYILISGGIICFVYKSRFKSMFNISSSFLLSALYPKLVLICYVFLFLTRGDNPYLILLNLVALSIVCLVIVFFINEYKKRIENRKELKWWLISCIYPLAVYIFNLVKLTAKH